MLNHPKKKLASYRKIADSLRKSIEESIESINALLKFGETDDAESELKTVKHMRSHLNRVVQKIRQLDHERPPCE